jgi:ketosteroid isomerase-like protein
VIRRRSMRVPIRGAIAVLVGLLALAGLASVAGAQSVADQIIAREKASCEAWQKKDKAFFANYFADDATTFMPENPYLQVDPKINFLPRLDEWFERYKILDFTMYNPRVQVYGDVAILTYNEAVEGTMGGTPYHYSGKVTSVYLKQGGTWRAVHSHESVNPSSH